MKETTTIELALVIFRKNSALGLDLIKQAAALAPVSYQCADNNSHANRRLASWAGGLQSVMWLYLKISCLFLIS